MIRDTGKSAYRKEPSPPLYSAERSHRFFPVLGNSSFLVRLSGYQITGLRPRMDAPQALSIRVDLDEDGLEVTHFWRQDSLVHQLYLEPWGAVGKKSSSQKANVEIQDQLLADVPVFIRRIHTDRPLTITLSSPAYVERNFYEDYPFRQGSKNCCRFFLRRGLPLADGFFSEKESTLLLFVMGSGGIKGRDSIAISPGEARICVVGDTPERALRLADHAAAHAFPSDAEKLSVYTSAGRKRTLSRTLFAHQAGNGGVIRSFDRPYVYTAEAPYYVKAFLAAGQPQRARALLSFFGSRYTKEKDFYPAYALNSEQVMECQNRSAQGLPILLAACLYFAEQPDKAFFDTLCPMLTAALYQADRGLLDGVACFSGAEELFEENPMRAPHLFDGSLPATLAYCDSLEKLTALLLQHSRHLPRNNGHLSRNAEKARKALQEGFSSPEGSFYLNSSKELARMRRPRFARLSCVGCYRQGPYLYTGILEKNRNQVYLCPRCMEQQRNFDFSFDPTERFGENTAPALLALSVTGRRLITDERLAPVLEREEASLDRICPTESGIRLALFYAACKAVGLSRRRLVRVLMELTDETGLLASSYFYGAPGLFTPSPAAMALLIASGFEDEF